MPTGTIVQTGVNKTGKHYGVRYGMSKDNSLVVPLPDREFDTRNLAEGDLVSFITDRKTGDAVLNVPKTRGCKEALG
ncbi:hypothetical protein HY345_01935 [Candidatus Microgenomates bacterium]|nr:hypothetical protein [Candidatus Microgenomates bacterium]